MLALLEVSKPIDIKLTSKAKMFKNHWFFITFEGLRSPKGRRVDTLSPPSWTPKWPHVEGLKPPKSLVFRWFLYVVGYLDRCIAV